MWRQTGMMTLEVMLTVILMAGLILLMGRTLNTHKKQQQAMDAGAQLATAVNAYFTQGVTSTNGAQQNFIKNTTYCKNNGNGVMDDVLSDSYLEATTSLGFNLCDAKIKITAIST